MQQELQNYVREFKQKFSGNTTSSFTLTRDSVKQQHLEVGF